MKYYLIKMNYGYSEEIDCNSRDLAVTDSEEKAKEISECLTNLAHSYEDYLRTIDKFKREYIKQNPRPVLQKQTFSLKSPPAYDDDKYMTVSKEYFDKYAEHLRLSELAEHEYKVQSAKWLEDLDAEIKKKFSFNFGDFAYHEVLGSEPDKYLVEGDVYFYYFEIDLVKS